MFRDDQLALLLPLPETGFVGSGIRCAEMKLDTLLKAEDHQVPVIGIYGIRGIGKTSLLKTVYSNYKKGNLFQAVIWITVSKRYNILDLQIAIADAINVTLGSSSDTGSISDADTIDVTLESSSDTWSSSDAGSTPHCDHPKMQRNTKIFLGSCSHSEMQRKTKLYASLKEMKFLLIIDDLWSPFRLQEEVGIPMDNHKGSKVVISTCSKDVIQAMEASYSITMQPLSQEEGWQLFSRVAFNSGSAPTESKEDVARKIARECKGLPLGIKVVAASMSCNASVIEWNLALSQMKCLDPVFLTTICNDELDLYKQLKWSYDHLPDSTSKNCFLYCAAFAEDEEIDVQTLLEIWIGEALVKSEEINYSMDIGLRYVKLLVDRGLFEIVDRDMMYIKVHDLVREMAIYIGKKEENCLFQTTQKVQKFPAEKEVKHCKRIAVSFYDTTQNVQNFPAEEQDCKRKHCEREICKRKYCKSFRAEEERCRRKHCDREDCKTKYCKRHIQNNKNNPLPNTPFLLALMLRKNECLREVPDGFFVNVTSLRVLDLSNTKINWLPDSMWQLTRVEFLKLSDTLIKHLPQGIRNLSNLQFLHLDSCRELQTLTSDIGELRNLKHLNLDACEKLTRIPLGISRLKSVIKLQMITGVDGAFYVENASKRLTGIPLCISRLKSVIKLQTTGVNGASNVEDTKKGVCTLKDLKNFPNLLELGILVNPGILVSPGKEVRRIEGMPPPEKVRIIRSGIAVGTMGTWSEMRKLTLKFNLLIEDLDKTVIEDLDKTVIEYLPSDMQNMKKLQIFILEDYPGMSLSHCICDLEQLEKLELNGCYQLEGLPPLERLPNLKSLSLINCSKLTHWKIETRGSVVIFPELESLYIKDLPMLESVTSLSSNGAWDEGAMPKLQVLSIIGCKLLKRLPIGPQRISNLKEIKGDKDWWEKLNWEI